MRPERDPAAGFLVIANWRDLDHPDAGGAELVCQELARHYAAGGRRVVLLTAAVAGRPREEQRDGYRIVRAGGRFTVYAHALGWLLRHRRSVDAVIDSQNGIPFFTPLAVSRRTPVAMLLHHVHQDQFAAYLPPALAAFGRWLEGPVSRIVYGRRPVVAVSPSTRTDARRRLRLRGTLWVATPGLSVTGIPDAERSSRPSIVAVGRLVPHKRTSEIVAALPRILERHPDLTVTLVGRGPERDALLSLARSLGVDGALHIRGDLDDAARDRALAESWLSVSASEGEGWGLSVLEANAQGIPVLGYRRRGLRDSIIDGRTGWLVEEGCDLADEIGDRIQLLRDPGVARRMAGTAREWAAQFTWSFMAGRIDTALECERDRLRSLPAAAPMTDAAVVVTIPADLLEPTWPGHLRRSDTWIRDGDDVRILCIDADVADAAQLLDRIGIPDGASGRRRCTIDVARTRDFLSLARLSDRWSAIGT